MELRIIVNDSLLNHLIIYPNFDKRNNLSVNVNAIQTVPLRNDVDVKYI